jgi:glycosyltransferase involved in cell wall biosynthesis
MASGVPVVASDIAIFREILCDSALLVPARHPGALADAMRRILTEEKLRNDLIGRGREHVKRYDWQRTAMETLKWFQHVARGDDEDRLPGK